MKNETILKKTQAKTLLKLIKEHKQKCTKPCGISIFIMLEVYEKLIGKKANDKEFEAFL